VPGNGQARRFESAGVFFARKGKNMENGKTINREWEQREGREGKTRMLGKLGVFRARVVEATMPEQRKCPDATIDAILPRYDANWIGE
jgi:hypothetical protein